LTTDYKLTVTDNPNGDLVITQAGNIPSKNSILSIPGDSNSNVLSGSYIDDEQNRYSEVSIRSQIKGNDTNFGKAAQRIIASATDSKVTRKRLLILDSSTPRTQSQAQEKVDWQIAYNSGKSKTLQCQVPGWDIKGNVWVLNTLVNVNDQVLGVKEILLITQLSFSQSESGTTTTITLHPKSAYIPEPKDPETIQQSKKGKKGKTGKQSNKPIPFKQWESNQGT
jgi:prophage tail gpP-like protein